MTKAMKMVAASRLKKAKTLVENSRPYAEKIEKMISNLASEISVRGSLSEKFPLLTGRELNQTHLLVVVSSDRGLCGGLNSSTVKFAKSYISQLISKGKKIKILCIGKKAYEQLKSIYADKIIECISGIYKKTITHEIAEEIAIKLVNFFDEKKFDTCEVIYSKFKSAISQEQVCQQLIPAKINIENNTKNHFESPISYEPNQEEILSKLLPKNLAVQIYNQLLESNASEQGARMAAMEAATNNSGKMIKNLTLTYNRTRQANITKELIDIVSGANVV
jgi:F-type H+-transporting ATPase subunit gamma